MSAGHRHGHPVDAKELREVRALIREPKFERALARYTIDDNDHRVIYMAIKGVQHSLERALLKHGPAPKTFPRPDDCPVSAGRARPLVNQIRTRLSKGHPSWPNPLNPCSVVA
jgi:hypothetical protein